MFNFFRQSMHVTSTCVLSNALDDTRTHSLATPSLIGTGNKAAIWPSTYYTVDCRIPKYNWTRAQLTLAY